MIQVGDEEWVNPKYVMSFKWAEYRSLTLTMVGGSELIVSRMHAPVVHKKLVGDFWK
jgi:hypothetical protein